MPGKALPASSERGVRMSFTQSPKLSGRFWSMRFTAPSTPAGTACPFSASFLNNASSTTEV